MKQGYQDVFYKREFWREISEQYSGKFSIIHTKSSIIERFNLIIPHNGINIEITESDTRPLKFSFNTEFQKEFEFNISQEDYTDKISKFFGKRELQIDDNTFNKRYFLSSRNDFLLKEFLNNSELTNQMKKLDVYTMNCKYSKENNKHQFLTVFGYNVNKKETLNNIIQFQFLIIRILTSLKIL